MLKKHKRAVLIGVMVFAVLLSAWLFLSPKMEKEQAKAGQDDLLASIKQGGGVIAIDETTPDIDVDFYDDDPVTVALPIIGGASYYYRGNENRRADTDTGAIRHIG